MNLFSGLVPLKHVLTPKYKGFHIALENLKDNLDAVYDATVIYSCTKGNKKTLRTKAPSMFGKLSYIYKCVHEWWYDNGLSNL